MLTSHRIRTVAFIGLGVAMVGCESGTAPEVAPEFDTEAALADYNAIDRALASADFRGFQALSGRTPFGTSPATIGIVAGMTAPDRADGGRAFALGIMERVRAAHSPDGPVAAPIISNFTRGATYVYDPDIDNYRLAVGREGAPPTGVRFILYEVDETGRPIVEQETGHADLIDEGDDSLEDIVLHLIVVQGGATVLDYLTTLDVNEGEGALTVRGFLRGDGVRLDFDIEAAGREIEGQQTLDVAFELRIDARDFSITGRVSGIEDATEGEGDVTITVRHRSDSVRLDVAGGNGMIAGTIFVNGQVFATVSGPTDEPTFLGRDGQPLTAREFRLLLRILDTVEDVFDLLEDLLDPVDDIVTLGIIL